MPHFTISLTRSTNMVLLQNCIKLDGQLNSLRQYEHPATLTRRASPRRTLHKQKVLVAAFDLS